MSEDVTRKVHREGKGFYDPPYRQADKEASLLGDNAVIYMLFIPPARNSALL